MRIAMWSGPRNLSTAMMYSFGARDDFRVVDEPFYAAYLHETGLDHPMRDAVIAAQSVDPVRVAQDLLEPKDRPHFYQKHMTQHMIEGVPREWMAEVVNVFLIRHPARVLASFAAKYENPTLADIGFVQQAELFEYVQSKGQTSVVIDSFDILRDPAGMLKRLCDRIGLNWDPAMLSWPSGGHPSDGIWAAHWYGAVHQSTGFGGVEGDLPDTPSEFSEILDQAMPIYETLSSQKIT